MAILVKSGNGCSFSHRLSVKCPSRVFHICHKYEVSYLNAQNIAKQGVTHICNSIYWRTCSGGGHLGF